ncbi:hypothetical protein CIB84_006381, partial [Bambusicola thoracicus]
SPASEPRGDRTVPRCCLHGLRLWSSSSAPLEPSAFGSTRMRASHRVKIILFRLQFWTSSAAQKPICSAQPLAFLCMCSFIMERMGSCGRSWLIYKL